MDVKIKCTHCGYNDLEEVDFPYKAKLIQTAIGIAGESSEYNLEEEYYTTTYICTKCGHFEFFNPKLAKLILEEREEIAKIENEITEIDNQILTNEKYLQYIEEEIVSIVNQMQDLDITVRQCNELKKKQKELENKIKTLNTSNKSLLQKKKNLKMKI